MTKLMVAAAQLGAIFDKLLLRQLLPAFVRWQQLPQDDDPQLKGELEQLEAVLVKKNREIAKLRAADDPKPQSPKPKLKIPSPPAAWVRPAVSRLFDQLDANKDGVIDRNEFKHVAAAAKPLPKGTRSLQHTPNPNHVQNSGLHSIMALLQSEAENSPAAKRERASPSRTQELLVGPYSPSIDGYSLWQQRALWDAFLLWKSVYLYKLSMDALTDMTDGN